MIRLTAAGQQKLDDVMPDYFSKVRALMTKLDINERDVMVSNMKLLASNLDVMK